MKAMSMFAGFIGCASVQVVLAGEEAKPKENVLHSFGSGADGQFPRDSLIEFQDKLYGITYLGGSQTGCGQSTGCGMVFAIDRKTGAETVVYSFCSQSNCADGDLPYAGLIDVKGMLYGTTISGGANNDGTVFALDPTTGAETVLYSFCSKANCADGEGPDSKLIAVDGTLYGTTYAGGSGGAGCGGSTCGTIFSVDPKTGAENVLYSFCSKKNCADGAVPLASLIDVKGTLYGTTSEGGGQTGCGTSAGCGTAFALNLNTDKETTLYSFCSQSNCTDGYLPVANLIDVMGTLYGTAYYGGTNGYGVVFAIDPSSGAETVVHTFCSQQNCADGDGPQSGLINVKGKMYGATQAGGANGGGTVFSLDAKTGAEKVLYTFCSKQDCTDGEQPIGTLIDVKGTLYGVTYLGGSNSSCFDEMDLHGCGTAFAVKP